MKRYIVWTLVILNSLIGVTRLIGKIAGYFRDFFTYSEIISNLVVIVVFSVMGALIILRTEGNRVGWLMILLGFVQAGPFATFLAFNELFFKVQHSFLVYFSYWTQGWFYFINIFAIFLIFLNFPDGHPPGPRWNWISIIAISTFAQFILVYTFQPQFGDSTTFIDNPIALLPLSAEKTVSGIIFGHGMILLAVSSIISIFVRYRRAGEVERSQIKWLLFSGTISIAAIAYRLAIYDPEISNWTDYLLTFALLSIAVSIFIAVLSYRLYEIDIIIRRTIQYALLSGLLVSIYFGSVILLQSLTENLFGKQSPVVIVISTLAIAALFNPLRIRLQDFIDRRFYRAKYDAEKALTQFAVTARDEVDVEKLKTVLMILVEDTMQPESVSLWMKQIHRSSETFMEQDNLKRGIQL